MAYQMRTFDDILNAICEQLKIQSSDTVTRNRIRRNINSAFDEVCAAQNWSWTRGNKTLYADAYLSTGTASVVSGSVTVTLSQAAAQNKTNYYFAVDGYNEIYRIRTHTAASVTLELETPFTGTTNATASYKVWTDAIPLPTDCREVIEVRHQFRDRPLENMGLQELRRVMDTGPKSEGRPAFHSVSDWQDPSPFAAVTSLPASVSRTSSSLIKTIEFATTVASLFTPGDRIQVTGAGDYSYNIEAVVSDVSGTSLSYTGTVPAQESATSDTGITILLAGTQSYDRYRELLIYPSISNVRTTMHLDYIKIVAPLSAASDEPPMPIQDRIVLFYGGMWLSADRERDPESSANYYALFQRRIEQMAAKSGDSPDKPVFSVSKNYLATKRNPSRGRQLGSGAGRIDTGGGSSGSVSGTANTVAVFDSSGNLISSPTISTTELAYLDNAEGLTSVTLVDNTSAGTALSWAYATYDSIHILYSINRSSTRESGSITISHDGSTASISQDAAGATDTGVTFDADISGSSVRLLYTTTSTGVAAVLKYEVIKWNS